ncbi:MAG: NADH-quinone oxidoreductase subunit C [Treponema sp.]|nr:NADH-quinone oxidoreductase subunit C [Treponema sp.]
MNQKIVDIEKIDLLNKALDLKNSGYRLGQICAVKLEKFMLLYTFIRTDELVTLRFSCENKEPVESLSWLYSYAFLYENEMTDLFGINVINMRINYDGHFYETAVKTPYNPAPAASAAPAAADGDANNG